MFKKYISPVLALAIVFGLFIIIRPAQATTLLTDDFTGTTINTSKWSETDPGGTGGTTGNITQNGSLSVTGNTTWGGVYLQTVDVYDRTSGAFSMDFDITIASCAGSSSIPGIGYGDPGVLTGGGQSYTMYYFGGTFYFSRQSANSNAENTAANVGCTDNTPMHVKIEVLQTIGAKIYLNNSSTADVTLTGGTFSSKEFFLGGQTGTALIDNVVISGPGAAVAPDAPTSLVATPASSQMALSWTAPASNGGSAITDYLVEYKLHSAGSYSTFADGTSTTASTIVTGLTNGLSYDFKVSAINSVGTGSASSVATATPALSAPTAPQSVAATVGVSAAASLAWSAPLSNGGASITDYIVEYKLASEPTTWTTFADGTSTSTAATVTGLTNGLSYNFRVSAVNSVGTGTVSSTVTATPSSYSLTDDFTGTTIDTAKWTEVDSTSIGGTAGNVRQNGSVTVSGIGTWTNQHGLESVQTFDRTNGDVSFTMTITRDDCGNGVGAAVMGYGDLNIADSAASSYILLSNGANWELYYWTGGGNVGGSGGGASPQTLSGFTSCTNGVPFTLTLKALQGGGASVYVNGSGTPSATITAGTFTDKPVWMGSLSATGITQYDNVQVSAPVAGPYAPTGVSTTPAANQVGLSWTAPDSNGSAITDYVIQYKLSSAGSYSTFADGTSTSTSTTVTGLTNGALYNFRIYAVNANGTSDASSVVNATPASATPTAPTASAVTISGESAVGSLLTGSYTYNDANGNAEATSTYRWLISTSSGGTYTAISGATGTAYTPVSGDLGKFIKFEVTPKTTVAPTVGTAVLSSATAAVGAEVPYVNLILSTGQSLSAGVNASPAFSTTQPYTNLMLTGGAGGFGTGGSFTPLVESGVETISSAMANTITANIPGHNYQVAVGLHGVSGYTYAQLKKGTGPYANGMAQVTNVKAAATLAGKSTRVIGVTTIHGETDNLNGVTGAQYEDMLEEWQNDYETDAKAITGQGGHIPLFTDQMSSFMAPYAYDATSEIPIYQLKASEDNVGLIYLVAPKYFFSYSDLHHLTGASSRWLGEFYGKVMKKVLVDGESWRPLSPDSATRSGADIYVDFHVPSGDLTFDTTMVSARTNYGFEYYDSTASASISSVTIVDSDTVKVTLNHPPTGSNQRVRYAYTGIPGTNTGAQIAGTAAGNLRDTDDFPSAYGNHLYNWAVHFDEAITEDSTATAISAVDGDPADTTAAVTWTTDEAASSQVQYGLTTSYGSTTSETNTSPRVTSHTVSLSGLVACTTYHFRVKSTDASSNLATGTDNTFTTTGCVGSAPILDESHAAVDNSTGGTASLTTGGGAGIDLDIPAGSAGANAEFQIKQLTTADALIATGTPTGQTSVGEYTYDLKSLTGVGTAVTSFSHPITLTFTYQDADVVGIDESSLVIYHYSSGVWTSLAPCTVDTAANTVTCDTTGFSVFSLFGTVSASSGTTSGSMARHPKGTNIVTSDGTIYTLTSDGKRRPYTSAGAYLSYGFNTWANAVPARQSDLTLAIGNFIPPRDGSVVCSDRGTDKGTCYLITGGKKAGFTSEAVFKAQGFSFSNALYGDMSFMSATANIDSGSAAHAEGVLVNNHGTLQIIGTSELIGIPSMNTLASWGYNVATAVMVNAKDVVYSQTRVLTERLAGVLDF